MERGSDAPRTECVHEDTVGIGGLVRVVLMGDAEAVCGVRWVQERLQLVAKAIDLLVCEDAYAFQKPSLME